MMTEEEARDEFYNLMNDDPDFQAQWGYCEDCAYDFGFISSPYGKSDTNPLWYHIDWESWADSMSQYYSQIDFDGDTYYWRA